MSIYNNRLMSESVCKKDGAYGECILQDVRTHTKFGIKSLKLTF